MDEISRGSVSDAAGQGSLERPRGSKRSSQRKRRHLEPDRVPDAVDMRGGLPASEDPMGDPMSAEGGPIDGLDPESGSLDGDVPATAAGPEPEPSPVDAESSGAMEPDVPVEDQPMVSGASVPDADEVQAEVSGEVAGDEPQANEPQAKARKPKRKKAKKPRRGKAKAENADAEGAAEEAAETPSDPELTSTEASLEGEAATEEVADTEGATTADSEAADGKDEETEENAPDPAELAKVLCALLLSSREPLTILRMSQVTNTSTQLVKQALLDLEGTLTTSGLPLELNLAGDQVRLLTAPEVFGYLSNLRKVKKQEKLSAAALETLAVVAYRQPVIRAEIEAIRGVKAGPILRTLLDHRMVKITGRADVPGRPLQYGTTQHFLESFGLKNVKDLPSVKEFRAL